MLQVKERKKPVRPHWMGLYKEAEKERKELEARVAELDGMERQCKILESQTEVLADQVDAVQSKSLEDKHEVACAEIEFLRGVVSELTATLKHAIKT